VAQLAAFVSLSFPALLKVIAWVLLLGPEAGALTTLLMRVFNLSSAPFNLFSFAGMILLESIMWSPIVFLLTVGPFSYMDHSLEEAAATSGANWHKTLRHVTLPLSTPALLGVSYWASFAPSSLLRYRC
jgi:iron(III) transport system permease protein